MLGSYITLLRNYSQFKSIILLLLVTKIVQGMLLVLYYIDELGWPDYNILPLDAHVNGYTLDEYNKHVSLVFNNNNNNSNNHKYMIMTATHLYLIIQVIEILLYIPIYFFTYSTIVYKIYNKYPRIFMAFFYVLVSLTMTDILENILLSILLVHNNSNNNNNNTILVSTSSILTNFKHMGFAFINTIMIYTIIIQVIYTILVNRGILMRDNNNDTSTTNTSMIDNNKDMKQY